MDEMANPTTKFLVSSNLFHHEISKAINEQPDEFRVEKDRFMFIKNDDVIIEFGIHLVKSPPLEGMFNSAKWDRLNKILSYIEEQPLTVIIEELWVDDYLFHISPVI